VCEKIITADDDRPSGANNLEIIAVDNYAYHNSNVASKELLLKSEFFVSSSNDF